MRSRVRVYVFTRSLELDVELNVQSLEVRLGGPFARFGFACITPIMVIGDGCFSTVELFIGSSNCIVVNAVKLLVVITTTPVVGTLISSSLLPDLNFGFVWTFTLQLSRCNLLPSV